VSILINLDRTLKSRVKCQRQETRTDKCDCRKNTDRDAIGAIVCFVSIISNRFSFSLMTVNQYITINNKSLMSEKAESGNLEAL